MMGFTKHIKQEGNSPGEEDTMMANETKRRGWVVRPNEYFDERYRGGRKAERQEEYDEFIDFLKDLSEEGKDAVAEFPIPKELKEDSVSTGIYAAAKRRELKVNIARSGVGSHTLLVRLAASAVAEEDAA